MNEFYHKAIKCVHSFCVVKNQKINLHYVAFTLNVIILSCSAQSTPKKKKKNEYTVGKMFCVSPACSNDMFYIICLFCLFGFSSFFPFVL